MSRAKARAAFATLEGAVDRLAQAAEAARFLPRRAREAGTAAGAIAKIYDEAADKERTQRPH